MTGLSIPYEQDAKKSVCLNPVNYVTLMKDYVIINIKVCCYFAYSKLNQ